jgi:NADH:ubiquinone oxidoreductase subunit 2 (subunit N)
MPVAWPLLLAAVGLGGVFAASARDVVWLVLAVETVAVAATFLVTIERPSFSIDRLVRAHVCGVIAFAVEGYGVSLVWLGAASTRFSVLGGRLGDRGGLAIIGLVVIGAGMVARAGAVAIAAPRRDVLGAHR